MKVSGVLVLLAAAFSSTSVLAAPVDAVAEVAAANLPGLDAAQSKNARGIIAENNKEKLGRQGCLAGITTALTESSVLILANKAVPASLKYAHDGLGSDHDSIGLFQQRAMYYKNIQCDMEAGCSASQFYKGMKAVKGWQTMEVGKLCQAVQKSAFPDAYEKHLAAAKKICTAAGL